MSDETTPTFQAAIGTSAQHIYEGHLAPFPITFFDALKGSRISGQDRLSYLRNCGKEDNERLLSMTSVPKIPESDLLVLRKIYYARYPDGERLQRELNDMIRKQIDEHEVEPRTLRLFRALLSKASHQ